jgi:acetyl-CoA synthetase
MMTASNAFANGVWNVPERFNIGVACSDAHLGTQAASRVAMIVDDEELGPSQLTFEQLALETSRFAELLRNLGIAPGARLIIRLPNSLMYPVAFLGTLKRGAICVPTSTLLTPTEIDFVIRDSGSAALVIHKAAWRELAPHLAGLPTLKHALLFGSGEVVPALGIATHDLEPALASIETFSPPHPTAADDPAYLVYTSGTTSYPKGVLHAHRALLGRTPAAQHWFDFHSGGVDRILHCGKFNWTYVLGTAMMDPFYWGKTVIVSEGRNDAHTWPRLIARHHATVFIGVPTIFRQILAKTACGKGDVPTLSHCMSAGEHLSDQVLAEWQDRFGLDIHEALGMTEFSYYLSQSKARPIRPGSAGAPQPGHEIQLLDPNTLEKVPSGEPGMICVPDHDPGLFLGYWNSPDETARLRKNGWFLTGDFARCDPDGYIWFLGRKDDMINSFGYRISPNEVERVFKSHSAVADCACVGESHGADKLLVVAYVIPKPESAVTPDELLTFGRQSLAKFKAPRIVYFTSDLPRTQNGKIRRQQIEPSMAIARSGADPANPRTET